MGWGIPNGGTHNRLFIMIDLCGCPACNLQSDQRACCNDATARVSRETTTANHQDCCCRATRPKQPGNSLLTTTTCSCKVALRKQPLFKYACQKLLGSCQRLPAGSCDSPGKAPLPNSPCSFPTTTLLYMLNIVLSTYLRVQRRVVIQGVPFRLGTKSQHVPVCRGQQCIWVRAWDSSHVSCYCWLQPSAMQAVHGLHEMIHVR